MAIFEPFLGDQNGHPKLDLRAYVLAEVGAVIRKQEREEKESEKKKQETAPGGPKRHANFTPSPLVCIPTPKSFGATLGGAYLAHIWRIYRRYVSSIFVLP